MSDALTALRRPPLPTDPVEPGVDPETLETLIDVHDRYAYVARLNQRSATDIVLRPQTLDS